MKNIGILLRHVLLFVAYSVLCLGVLPDKGFGGMIMAMLISVHVITLATYCGAAERGSDAKWQYFLLAIFVLLVGPSMCVSTVFN